MMVLDVGTVLCVGLLIGTEFAVSVFINPILRKLDIAARLAGLLQLQQRSGIEMGYLAAIARRADNQLDRGSCHARASTRSATNGLLRRSCPKVEIGPWPGTKTVSSPIGHSRVVID